MNDDREHRRRVAAALAVGEALGYVYTGDDLYAEIGNPRVNNWFAVADAAIVAHRRAK